MNLQSMKKGYFEILNVSERNDLRSNKKAEDVQMLDLKANI